MEVDRLARYFLVDNLCHVILTHAAEPLFFSAASLGLSTSPPSQTSAYSIAHEA